MQHNGRWSTPAEKLINDLAWAEVGVPKLEPDARRAIQEERIAVEAAIDSGDDIKIDAAMKEARRVAAMWGVKVK